MDEREESLIPAHLYEDVKQQRVVLLCGAGVTTEQAYGGPSFYHGIGARCGLAADAQRPPFPDLMQRFCDVCDGGNKRRLVQEAVSRIERFSAPGEANRFATAFYSHIAMVPFFDRIVTTNWDPLCERTLNILVPMVEGRDLSFWNDDKRQVLKLHGCITRPDTIIATRNDYNQSIAKNPLIWNKLKDLLATRLLVVVGYSMMDDDFSAVFREITTVMGPLRGLTYAYDPNASDESIKSWADRHVKIIRGYGLAFARDLLHKLAKDDIVPDESVLSFFSAEGERITKLHLQTSAQQEDSDGAFASSMYQDGVLHAIEEVCFGTMLGVHRRVLDERLRESEENTTKYNVASNFVEVAYWTGRCEVLRRFNSRKLESIPAFFHPHKMTPIFRLKK